MCVCVCVCVGGGAFCVCVWERGEILGDEGEHLKFYGHVLYINEFAVENLCLSG